MMKVEFMILMWRISVLKEILEKKNNCSIIYGDSGNNPWGNKSKETLHQILLDITAYFEKHNVSHIITGATQQ